MNGLGMGDFAPFLVIGLATGSLYGLAAMGLVLTYKTSGIFNFGHGALAAVAAYVYYDLRVNQGMPTPFALLISVVLLPPLLGMALERVTRVLARGGTTPRVVAMVGLQIAITSLLLAYYGSATVAFPSILPTDTFTVGSVFVGYDQAISLGLGAIAAATLYAFFRRSRLGVNMRAVVDDPDLLSLSGSSPARVRAAAWLIGSWFAALSGVLLAPIIGLDAPLLTLLVVQAFGAAAIGLFRSIPLTYVGGLIIGVGSSLTTMNPFQWSALEGVASSVPFLALFVVLLVAGRARLVDLGEGRAVAGAQSVHPSVERAAALLGLLVAVVLPFVVGAKLPVYINAMALIVVFYSLSLLVRMSGQVSLAHASFVAVGAVTFAHTNDALPWLGAVLVAGLVTVPIGLLVAVPAIRLSGLYLALATLGFGLLLERAFFNRDFMFGTAGSLAAPRPSWDLVSSDKGYYFLLLAFVVAVGLAVALINASRLGRLLRGLADSPTTLTTLGLSTNLTRLLVFSLSAFIAGVGGALIGGVSESVSSVPFNAFVSLTWVCVLVLSGRHLHLAPILAAVGLAIIPAYITSESLSAYFPVVFGVGAVAAAMTESIPRRSSSAPTTATSSSRAQERLSAPPIVSARSAVASEQPHHDQEPQLVLFGAQRGGPR